MLSRVQQDFNELQKVKKICSDNLAKARALFPNNEELKEYEQRLAASTEERYKNLLGLL